jgi:hypothetical protein
MYNVKTQMELERKTHLQNRKEAIAWMDSRAIPKEYLLTSHELKDLKVAVEEEARFYEDLKADPTSIRSPFTNMQGLNTLRYLDEWAIDEAFEDFEDLEELTLQDLINSIS